MLTALIKKPTADRTPHAPSPGLPIARVVLRIPVRALDAAFRRRFARSHDGVEADIVALNGGVGLTETYVEAALPFSGPTPGTRFRARLALRPDGTLEVPSAGPPPDRLQGS